MMRCIAYKPIRQELITGNAVCLNTHTHKSMRKCFDGNGCARRLALFLFVLFFHCQCCVTSLEGCVGNAGHEQTALSIIFFIINKCWCPSGRKLLPNAFCQYYYCNVRVQCKLLVVTSDGRLVYLNCDEKLLG